MSSSSESQCEELEDIDCRMIIASDNTFMLDAIIQSHPELVPALTAHALIKSLISGNCCMHEHLVEEHDGVPDYDIVMSTALCYGLDRVLVWCRDNFEMSDPYKEALSTYFESLTHPEELAGDNEDWKKLIK